MGLEPDVGEPPHAAAREEQSADGCDRALSEAAGQDGSRHRKGGGRNRTGRDLKPGGEDVFVPDTGQEEDVRQEHRSKRGEEKGARDVRRAEGA